MKRLLCAMLLISILLVACEKENALENELEGTWNWEATYNGSPANTQTPASTGITETLKFDGDNWTQTQNAVVVNSGTFRVSSNQAPAMQALRVNYHSERTGVDSIAYFQVSATSLIFSDDFGPSGTIGAGSKAYKR